MSQKRVSGFPEKGADLWGSPGTSGEVLGNFRVKFGKLPGNLWIAVKFHSERTSGEVAENFRGSSGNFRASPGAFPEARGSLTPYQRLAKNVSPKKKKPGALFLRPRRPTTKVAGVTHAKPPSAKRAVLNLSAPNFYRAILCGCGGDFYRSPKNRAFF